MDTRRTRGPVPSVAHGYAREKLAMMFIDEGNTRINQAQNQHLPFLCTSLQSFASQCF